MSRQHLPNEFRDLVPMSEDTLCDKIKNSWIILPKYIADHYSWMYDDDGALSDEFVDLLKEAGIGGGSVPTTAPATPRNLVANSTLPSTIKLTWLTSANAASYRVYRSTTDGFDVSDTNYIGESDGEEYMDQDDSMTIDETYYYRVVAVNQYGESGQSNIASAMLTAGDLISFVKTGSVIPITVADYLEAGDSYVTADIYVWGAGGRGSRAVQFPNPNAGQLGQPPYILIGGSGGASGNYVGKTGVDLTGVTTLNLYVGAGATQFGAPGKHSYVDFDGNLEFEAGGGGSATVEKFGTTPGGPSQTMNSSNGVQKQGLSGGQGFQNYVGIGGGARSGHTTETFSLSAGAGGSGSSYATTIGSGGGGGMIAIKFYSK